MAQRAIVSLRGVLRDDENWPDTDETAPVARDGADTLTSIGNEVSLISSDDCSGDEVRLISMITCVLLGDQRTLSFTGDFHLYEGDDCNAQDPEGPSVSVRRTVSPGATTRVDIRVPGDGAGDFVGWLSFANRDV